jgi:hypothetical protein
MNTILFTKLPIQKENVRPLILQTKSVSTRNTKKRKEKRKRYRQK